MRCWTRNISLLSAALCWVLPVPAPCNANPAHFGAFPNTFIPDLVPGELCPPLTQPLKTLNPLDGSSPDFHTHPAWRGTKSSICALLGGAQTCSTASQAAAGAGHSWHLIFLNFPRADPASSSPAPAVVGSSPWAQPGCLCAAREGNGFADEGGWDINAQIKSCCLSYKAKAIFSLLGPICCSPRAASPPVGVRDGAGWWQCQPGGP